MDNSDIIGFSFIFLLGIYALFKFLIDQQYSFEVYLKPDLESKGFIFISSMKCISKPVHLSDERDIEIKLGALWVTSYWTIPYSIYRKVAFLDSYGTQHKVLASIDFDEFFFKKFKGVRWKPDLSSFDEESTKAGSSQNDPMSFCQEKKLNSL
jgi:hypothetical protein